MLLIFTSACDEEQISTNNMPTGKELDSIVCVAQIANYSNGILESIDGFEGLEDIDDVAEYCRITNSDIEGIIINFANKYYGGQSRTNIASALDDITDALAALGDKAGNNDGIYSVEERAKMSEIVETNNGLFLLFCLYDAYEDTPRK
ncbi:MAG: hypothetical protein ACKUBY_04215 [Candidatus Moraniibacteriota bacterium]|jgi:hypothetical protein